MKEKITEEQRISVLDLALQDTPAKYWATHKASIIEWEDEKQTIRCQFQGRDWLKEETKMYFQDAQMFNERSDPHMHIEHFLK